jgi:hypothetical protein
MEIVFIDLPPETAIFVSDSKEAPSLDKATIPKGVRYIKGLLPSR